MLKPLHKERRRRIRHNAHLAGHAVQDGYEIPCVVLNVTASGAQAWFDPVAIVSLRNGRCVLHIPRLGDVPARILWTAAYTMGFRFDVSPLFEEMLSRKLSLLHLPQPDRVSLTG